MERRPRDTGRQLRQRRAQHRLPTITRNALPEVRLQIDEARMIRLAERPSALRCGLALRQFLQPRDMGTAIVVELGRRGAHLVQRRQRHWQMIAEAPAILWIVSLGFGQQLCEDRH